MFEVIKDGCLGSAVFIDSKFSNFNKLIEFEGDVSLFQQSIRSNK